MVKQAEKRRKRSPFLPILGLFLAIVLLVISFSAAQLIVKIPAMKTALNSLAVVKIFGQQVSQGVIMMTILLWLVLLAIAYFLVALMIGKDPESTKDIPLPPRERDRKPTNRR